MKRPRLARTLAVLFVIGLFSAIAIALPRLPKGTAATPSARVTKGPLKLTVHATGELRAGRTMTLVTPTVGGMLRIVHMIPTGMPVKAGEVVMEFDPADQVYALEQAKSELAEADQNIVKMKADAAVQAAQDEEALLTARFDVRRAELDASGNEFISAIEAKKNLLSLEEAKRRLSQLEEDVKSRSVTNQASLAVATERRNKATMAMQRAEQVIQSLELRAPLDGVVSVKQNTEAAGGMFFGQTLPEYRQGDSVWPGRAVADVIESGKMELRAKVNEIDRANLLAGQESAVYIDTLPGETFTARVGTLAGLASRANFFESASVTRQFDVKFEFVQPDPRMKAGASARVVIDGKEIPDALHVPRQAVFEKNGKNHVFVKVGERFEPREVKITHKTESRIAVEGLQEGAEVALVDPTAAAAPTPAASTSPMPAGGGPR
jgi:multidrug efflux pump subunit AcrA (membrane-fusion protein)